MKTPASAGQGLSVSFSNLSDRGELHRRSRADTFGSTSSGGAGRSKGEGLSMTPNTSQQSRPTTPNVVGGKDVLSHVKGREVGEISSSAEGSVTGRARRATSSASWVGRKAVGRSRSPSRARMRVKGFGLGAEVEIDEENDEVEPGMERDRVEADRDAKSDQLATKFDSLRIESSLLDDGEKEGKKRRISTASERPDLPPPSESDTDHNSACSCDKCTFQPSSSSSSVSSWDFSLSSELDSDSYSPNPHHHRRQNSTSSSNSSTPPELHRINTITTASEQDFTESLIIEPSRASRRENEYISTIVSNKDPVTVKNFFRLLPYLNGKHTIDEIEYRVRMRRRDIRRLLAVFRDCIVTFLHP